MDQDKPNKPTLVRDLMSVGVYTCTPETTIEVVARALLDMDLDAGVVLDYNGHAIGVASRDDLVRAFARGLPGSTPVEQVMGLEASFRTAGTSAFFKSSIRWPPNWGGL